MSFYRKTKTMQNKTPAFFTHVLLLLFFLFFSTILTWYFSIRSQSIRDVNPRDGVFNETRAFRDVEYQTNLGARIPGSEAHQEVAAWLQAELSTNAWDIQIQEGIVGEVLIKNIIGKKGKGKPWTIIGAHYDSRLFADKDPVLENRQKPVPGANDGASGVAILLELSRILNHSEKKGTLWLVFFDAEDNGNINNRSWIMGSQYFVDSLTSYPDRVVILDMIGDKDLGIYQEKNSDQQLTQEIWNTAIQLGYGDYFISKQKYRILDDHVPFLEKGIPAIDVIDFEYPYWHTSLDTVDKVSPVSLKVVGETIKSWYQNQP
jgi:glutaminyl-peptide cyclotransferase